jgi:hypothetical protein
MGSSPPDFKNKQPKFPAKPSESSTVDAGAVTQAFIQAGLSAARSQLLRDIEKDGTLVYGDFLAFVERTFDSVAQVLVGMVHGTTSAEKCSSRLEVLTQKVIEHCPKRFWRDRSLTQDRGKNSERASRKSETLAEGCERQSWRQTKEQAALRGD